MNDTMTQCINGHYRHIYEPICRPCSEPVEPTLDDVIRETVVARLKQYESNKTRAANSLGITIKTLYTWLHRWNLFEEYKTNGRR